MLVEILVLLLCCAPFLWWYLILWKYRSTKKIPGPTPRPLVGNALEIGNTPQEFLNALTKLVEDYGDVVKFYIANELRIMITNPQTAEQLLNSNIHITKSNAYDFFKPWLGVGLLTSTGTKWKSRRKMITPTLHFKILDQFLEVFNSCGNILVEKLSNEVGKEYVDVYPFINLCSLDIICETAMGVKVAAQNGENSEYVEAVRGYLDIFIYRTFSSWARLDFFFRMSRMYNPYKKYLKILHQFTNNIIKTRREQKTQHKSFNSSDDNNIKRKVALLDMLLESEDDNKLSNEDIREEIDTFMFEGHDTTTSGIAFALLCLADNPDIQEKVYDEVISVVGGEDTKITMQHLQETKYLEIVIKEVQRMYPSVPAVERLLEHDTIIDGYSLPKDIFLTIFIYGMHHNEKYFKEPEKFDPERFLPENQTERHNYAYVPFSAGPRNCIGQKFAMLEMKATIIKIVRKFQILSVPGYKPDLGMAAILKSYNGVCVRLQHR